MCRPVVTCWCLETEARSFGSEPEQEGGGEEGTTEAGGNKKGVGESQEKENCKEFVLVGEEVCGGMEFPCFKERPA